MKILPTCSKNSKNKLGFKSETQYKDSIIIENNLLSLSQRKSFSTYPDNPELKIIQSQIEKVASKKIEIRNKNSEKIATINFNPDKSQPLINFQTGAFEPLIEIYDDELGLTLLITKNSFLKGNDLKIDYSNRGLSFLGNKLVVTTGYKTNQTKSIVDYYINEEKSKEIQKSLYADLLKKEYTFVALAGGYGTRLKPISNLDDSNKIGTKIAMQDKSIFELSVLDSISKIENIKNANFIEDDEKNLSGTAGVIIKGLKNGTIPKDKPLVLMTGDIFHNIDLAHALYNYEQDDSIGIAMLVSPISDNDLIDSAPIKFDSDNIITNLYPKINEKNKQKLLNEAKTNGKLYKGTNITIISPAILNYLERFADKEGKADFLRFLGLMYNTLNKTDESLLSKYSKGLDSKDLSIKSLVYPNGYPKQISNGRINQKLKAITTQDIEQKEAIARDIGTIENYIKTIKEASIGISGFNSSFIKKAKEAIDSNGVIYLNPEAKSKLEKFKQKYNIKTLNGNIIVHSRNPVLNGALNSTASKNIYSIKNENFIIDALKNPTTTIKNLIKTYGFNSFIKWYLDSNGFYGMYEKFLDNFFKNAKSIDELLKFQPNWAYWKLEEKAWIIGNNMQNKSEEEINTQYKKYCEEKREYPLKFGELPDEFESFTDYRELIDKLKTQNIKETTFTNYCGNYKVKKLKGGGLNDKFIYLIEFKNKKYIIKIDRVNIEDSEFIDGRDLSNHEKRAIRKNKFLSADSIFSNACINRYLELNGCKNVAHLYFYDHRSHSAVYEYIEDKNGDEFQKSLIDEEYINLDETNKNLKNLNDLGVYINDTAIKNILTDKDNTPKLIDLGHCNFIHPFKLGVKKYTAEFSNSNGPDLRNIFAGILMSLCN